MTQLPAGLVDYLAARDRARHQQTDDAIAALTDREQALVREAAVMGYVQGAMAHGQPIPTDTSILRTVVSACQAMPELYPNLSAQPRSSR